MITPDDSGNQPVPHEAEPPHSRNAKTLAEQLDEAKSGEEFQAVLNRVFAAAFYGLEES